MPETALLSAFMFFFKIQVFKSPFLDKLNFLLPLGSKLLFLGIPHTTWTPLPLVTCGTVQCFFERSFHHTRGPSPMISAWLVTSSAQLRPAALAQQRSAVQCRSLACPAVRCGTVRCCAVLRDAVPCCAVWVSTLL